MTDLDGAGEPSRQGLDGAGEPSRQGLDVAGYLRRLRLDDLHPDRAAPSAEGLRRIQQAHVERVPYENVEIQLGRPTTVDPHESAARIIGRSRGGYCFHLNGALAALLAALGYDVRRHVGGVQGRPDTGPVGATGNHLALTVHGLPTADSPAGGWFVDAGLGDGLHSPLPLVPGEYRQGPFRFVLRPSEVIVGGWRFDHDPSAGSFVGMDFGLTPATPADFADQHRRLSTEPTSGFVRVFTAMRRHATGADTLRGCLLRRADDPSSEGRELQSAAEWYAVLDSIFGLTFDDLADPDRLALWRRVRAAHDEWRRTLVGAAEEATGEP